MLDANTLRRVLYDLFRFDRKDFFVSGSGTSFLISLARRSSASPATRSTTFGFDWSLVKTDDETIKVKLYEGQINSNIIPDNMGSVFDLDDDADNYLICTTNNDVDGVVTSAELSVNGVLPGVDPAGSLGVAPPTSSRALWKFSTEKGKITQAIAYRIGGLEVTPIVVGMSCERVLLRMFWGPSQTPPPELPAENP